MKPDYTTGRGKIGMGEFIKLSLFCVNYGPFNFPNFPKKLSITFYYFLKLSDVSETSLFLFSALIIFLTLHSQSENDESSEGGDVK